MISVQAAFGHIVDASSRLTREQALVGATALQAGWMTDDERRALADLAAGFERLSAAGSKEVAS